MLKKLICLFGCTFSTFLFLAIWIFDTGSADRQALLDEMGEFLPHIRLAKDLMDQRRYDNRVRPVMNHTQPTTVLFSMSLYQILAINEKQQNIDLNVWAIQKWNDDFLGWNPYHYGMINTTILPFEAIWLPDTYIYNSVVMNREETERYINVVITTNYWKGEKGAEVKFMYPALYRTSCLLDISYFPYDAQNCKLIISSWTSDKADINYEAEYESVNLDNFIPNEEWVVTSFNVKRNEQKFVCCPNPWVLLEATLVVRRKPLYYIVNLVIPTSVITLVAVTGFFTAASTSSERREKLSLGIDSLLAMSILMMMVSEQMPTTSEGIPLFGLFYLTIIFIIFIGTLFTAFVLNVHLQKMYNKPVPPIISFIFFHKFTNWLKMRPPTQLIELWEETGVRFGATREIAKQRAKQYKEKHKERKFRQILPSSSSQQAQTVESVKRAQARENWRRLTKRISEKSKDGTLPSPLNLSLPPRQFRTRPPSICFDDIPSVLMHSSSDFSATDTNLFESKLKRRYALEWEYLATVLDRLLLILFSILVVLVTLLMMLIGEAMHLSYEYQANQERERLMQAQKLNELNN